MALNFNYAFYTFHKGLNQKTQKELLNPPYVLTCNDAVFLKTGSVQKRTGYDYKSTGPDSFTGLTNFHGSILAQSASDLYAYSDLSNKWSGSIGTKKPYWLTHFEVFRSNYNATDPDMALDTLITANQETDVNTTAVIAWVDTRGSGSSVRCRVLDFNGNTIIPDTEISASGRAPKVTQAGAWFWIVYNDTTDNGIKARRINRLTPNILGNEIVLVAGTNVHADSIWDMDFIPELEGIIVVYKRITSGFIYAKYFDRLGNAGAGVAVNGLPTETQIAGEAPTTQVSISNGVSTVGAYYNLCLYDNGGDAKFVVVDFTLNAVVAPTVYEAAAGTIGRFGTLWRPYTAQWIVLTSINAPASTDDYITKGVVGLNGLDVTPFIYQRGATLYTNPSTDFYDENANNNMYFWVLFDSQVQPTYFLLREQFSDDGYGSLDGYGESTTIVAKHLQGLAGSSHSIGHIGNYSMDAALLKKDFLTSTSGTVYANDGVTWLDTISYLTQGDQAQIAQVGTTGLMTGGLCQVVTNQSVDPVGFSLYPEIVSCASAGAGSVAPGTYLYVATYQWTDANGDIHESAPSVPFSYTISGSAEDVDVTIPTLRLDDRTGVVINVYRTTAGGTLYYQVSPTNGSFTFNDPTVDSVVFTDDVSDAAIAGNKQLYTTGGVLEAVAPPYTLTATTFKGRVFVAGDANQPHKVWFSQPYIQGVGLQFNELLSFDVEPGVGGYITALAYLDDNLIIFKESIVYFVQGLGPDRTGGGSDYDPRRIQSDVGCLNPFSIVTTPDGIMFQSTKGIWKINRQLQVVYIGAPVEDFFVSNAPTDKHQANPLSYVYAATLHAGENAVRLFLDTGEVLYYNYFHDVWSVHTNYNASGACVRPISNNYIGQQGIDDFFFVRDNGAIFKANTSSYLDNGAPIRMKIRTTWINPSGQKWQFCRIPWMVLFGERLTDHLVTMNIYYDESDVVTETVTFNVTSSDSLYGEGQSWGSDTYYGGGNGSWGDQSFWGSQDFWGGSSNDVMSYRHMLKQQKCYSISFEFLDDIIPLTGGPANGPSFTLMGIGLTYGLKKGPKFNQARTI